jgi:hypothetical protein
MAHLLTSINESIVVLVGMPAKKRLHVLKTQPRNVPTLLWVLQK